MTGDCENVTIGQDTVIGERCVLHVPTGVDDARKTKVGNDVYLDAGCVLNGCTIEDGAFISASCVIQDGAVVGAASKLEAGSVVLPGTRILAGQLWAGNPATYQRDLTPEEQQTMQTYTQQQLEFSEKHTYWHELTPRERETVRQSHLPSGETPASRDQF